jgi:thiol-disulfide isomerase/thioredoxin
MRSTTLQRKSGSRSRWLWVGIVVTVAVALGLAVWTTRGEDGTTAAEGTAAPGGSTNSPAESQPVTVSGAALPTTPEAGPDPALGITAPTLHGFGFDGTPIDITADGGPKMVVFLAHWCPHCNREIPVLQSWAASGRMPAGLDIVGVSTSAAPQRDNFPPSSWIKAKRWTWPVLADSVASDAAIAYGVAGFPTFVIVGADGAVKARSSGELPVDELDALVRQAIA